MPDTSALAPKVLSVTRIMVGLLFFSHGISKFFNLPPFGTPLNPLLDVAGAMELVGGALIVVGLFTRPVAFLLSGQMAVAYFLAHAPAGFLPLANHGEPAILYCFIFLYFAAAGGGAWSLDAGRARR